MITNAVKGGGLEPVSAPAGRASIVRHTITDSEAYTAAVSGAHVEAVQRGQGSGLTVIRTVVGQKIVATSGTARIPIAHYSTLRDDVVAIAYIHAASPGSRWCGIDLAPDTVLVYSPSAEHVGVDEPGLEFTFAVATLDQLREVADGLQVPLAAPRPGEVRAMRGQNEADPVVRGLGALAASLRRQEAVAPSVEDDVVCAMVDVLATSTSAYQGVKGSGMSSLLLTRACVDYAESIGRMPSLGELCLATGVSERRLRSAFGAEFGISPARFFRIWALDKAHNRFARSIDGGASVTQVATDLGFQHLGRFSKYYRELYGVTPTRTRGTAVPESRDRGGLSPT